MKKFFLTALIVLIPGPLVAATLPNRLKRDQPREPAQTIEFAPATFVNMPTAFIQVTRPVKTAGL